MRYAARLFGRSMADQAVVTITSLEELRALRLGPRPSRISFDIKGAEGRKVQNHIAQLSRAYAACGCEWGAGFLLAGLGLGVVGYWLGWFGFWPGFAVLIGATCVGQLIGRFLVRKRIKDALEQTIYTLENA